MMLDRQNHFGKKSQKHGNCRAVLLEAMQERRCNDPDLCPEKTGDNEYWDINSKGIFEKGYDLTSGNAWADWYEEQAESYRVVDKNGKEKRLRSDANISFAGIIKPNEEFMSSLSADEQYEFLNDSVDCVNAILKKRGMIMNAAVLHTDEGNPHIHYFGYDPQYKLSSKFNLSFYRALNVTEYPKLMREKGWDIKPLTGYLEDTKGMTEEQVTAYKSKKKASRQAGKPSEEFKAEQDRLKAERERDRVLAELEQAEREQKALEAKISDLKEKGNKYLSSTKKRAQRDAEAIRRQAELEAEEIRQQAIDSIPVDIREKARKWDEHVKARTERTGYESGGSRQNDYDFSK